MAAAVEAKGMDLGEAAIEQVAQRLDAGELAKNLAETSLRSSMLGAMDADFEEEEDTTIEPSKFGALRLEAKPFTVKPFDAAIKDFEERQVVTRDVFDKMTDAAKQRAFTVAGLTSEKVINEVKNELRESLAKGEDIRKFKKRLRENMATKGWLKPGPKKEAPTKPGRPWHLETIYRNNVQASYARGRQGQMLQPEVVSRLPFWEIVTADDERVRPSHEAAHGKILRADDPFWQSVGTPPWGHNCRCRVVSRTPKQAAKRAGDEGINTGDQIEGLPDKNFAGQKIEAAPELPIDLFEEVELPELSSPIPLPKSEPTAEADPFAAFDALRKAETLEMDLIAGDNANTALEARFSDGAGGELRGIFKPASGEVSLRIGIEPGTYYRRETAVAEIDALMGGETVVPPTVTREVVEQIGSVQKWEPGAKDVLGIADDELAILNTAEIAEAPSVRRQFMLDVTMQNTDRHGANTLWKVVERGGSKQMQAVAIDNGATLPTAASHAQFKMPTRAMGSEEVLSSLARFDDQSLKQLRRLTPDKLAELLARNNIEPKAARAAMIRVEAIKANPNVIGEIEVSLAGPAKKWATRERVSRFWDFSHKQPAKLVDKAQFAEIRAAIKKAYGG